MQQTRLNNLPGVISTIVNQWLQNPWRRYSLHIVAWLGGFLVGIVIATYSGQKGIWDFVAAGFTIGVVEAVSWLHYRAEPQSTIINILHSLKTGLTFNLILEAFKLGS